MNATTLVASSLTPGLSVLPTRPTMFQSLDDLATNLVQIAYEAATHP
jgi:hypothetical protein